MTSNFPRQDGRLIVIEGIDGAGTTTQARLLTDLLSKKKRAVASTAEPSKGPIGVLIRQILSGRLVAQVGTGAVQSLDHRTVALLFAADRIDHLQCEVLPLLENGIHVVCDRYVHSSLTYQTLQGLEGWVAEINRHARQADVTYLLDLKAEDAASRMARDRHGKELYDALELQRRIRQAYLDLVDKLPGQNLVVLDGTQTVQEVCHELVADLSERFLEFEDLSK